MVDLAGCLQGWKIRLNFGSPARQRRGVYSRLLSIDLDFLRRLPPLILQYNKTCTHDAAVRSAKARIFLAVFQNFRSYSMVLEGRSLLCCLKFQYINFRQSITFD